MGAIYVIRCITCKRELDPTVKETPALPGGIKSCHYLGMTATSCHNRMLSHIQSHNSKSNSSIMHRHDTDCHNGVAQQYQMDVVTTERRLLSLCMREALLIEGQDPKLSINDKMELGRGSIVRLAATR